MELSIQVLNQYMAGHLHFAFTLFVMQIHASSFLLCSDLSAELAIINIINLCMSK